MSVVEIDLNNGLLTAGRYDAEVYTIEEKQGKNGKYYRLSFQITTGEGAGRLVADNRSWILMPQLLVATNIIQPGQRGKVNIDLEELLGWPVVIDVSIGSFNDKEQNNVDRVWAVDAPEIQPVSAAQRTTDFIDGPPDKDGDIPL